MAEFEEKLNSILSDPKAMGQIMSIAKALGAAGEEENAADSAPAGNAAAAQDSAVDLGQLLSPLGSLDPKLVQTALRLFSEYNTDDNRRTTLLAALQPFLKEERQAKVEKAVQITKLSRIARVAFHLLKGEEADV